MKPEVDDLRHDVVALYVDRLPNPYSKKGLYEINLFTTTGLINDENYHLCVVYQISSYHALDMVIRKFSLQAVLGEEVEDSRRSVECSTLVARTLVIRIVRHARPVVADARVKHVLHQPLIRATAICVEDRV